MVDHSKPYIPFVNIRYCGAKTRTTDKPCRGSAMKNGRCRMHGGKSTGRPVTTGLWSKESIKQRRKVGKLIHQVNAILNRSP